MGRRRRDMRGDAPVTRDEFEALEERVRRAIQKGTMGMGVQSVLGGGGGGDDGYEWWFDGRTTSADDADTVGGLTPEELAPASDGSAPGSSPTSTVQGGPAYLNVKWTAVANADLVTYEVHLGTASGFTADATTKIGETPGLQYFIHKAVDGSALLYDTDYYVKLIARDADGSAAASVASAAEQLDPNGSNDILANSINAEHVDTVFAVANSFVAGTPGAQRLEFGYGTDEDGELDPSFIGIRQYDVDGTTVIFRVDQAGVYVKGRFDYGAGSRLESDIVEIQEQADAGFLDFGLVQHRSFRVLGASDPTGVSWGEETTNGNFLLRVVTAWKSGGAPTMTMPAGDWIEVCNRLNGDIRLGVWYIPNADPRSGSDDAVDLSATATWTDQLYEFSGLDVLDVSVTHEENAPPASSGSVATTFADDVEIAILHLDGNVGVFTEGSQTAGYELLREVADTDGSLQQSEAVTFTRVVSATETAELTCGTARPDTHSVGCLLAVQRKPFGVDTPLAGKVRLYGRDVSSVARLHVMHEDGGEASLMLAQDGEYLRVEIVTASVNIPSTVDQTGGSLDVTVPGVAIGDSVFGGSARQDSTGRNFGVYAASPVTVADTVTLQFFNADNVTSDPGTITYDLLVIHRS